MWISPRESRFAEGWQDVSNRSMGRQQFNRRCALEPTGALEGDEQPDARAAHQNQRQRVAEQP